MRSPTSLRTRLALLIAVLVVSMSWIFGAFISKDFSARLRESAGFELAELAYQMGDRLDRDMAARAQVMTAIAELDVMRQTGARVEQQRIINQLQTSIGELAWMGLLDADGTVQVASQRILEGVNIAQRPVYQQGKEGLFVGDVHEAVLLANLLPNPSGETMKFVDISLPIRSADGQLSGVLASHLSWAWAAEVSQSLLNPAQQRRSVEFFVLSAEGTVLLGPPGWVGESLEPLLEQRIARRGANRRVVDWAGPQPGRYLTAIARTDGHADYPGLGWAIVARQPLQQADAPAHALRRDIVIAGTLLAVVFAVAGWLGSRRLTRPLRQIVDAADKLAAGKPAQIPIITGARELEVLSRSIRRLVDALGQQENRLGEMSELALTDRLTGLANRAGFESYLRRHDPHNPMALLFLDLDGFKQVNDQLGHAAGDELLRLVAERLRAKVRDGDLLVRLGGDEFVMVLNIKPEEMHAMARQVAVRTLDALGAPMLIAGHQARVGCSIGGAFWPADGQTPEEVLARADRALYQAKAQGKHQVVFTTDG